MLKTIHLKNAGLAFFSILGATLNPYKSLRIKLSFVHLFQTFFKKSIDFPKQHCVFVAYQGMLFQCYNLISNQFSAVVLNETLKSDGIDL